MSLNTNETQSAFFYIDGVPTKGAWVDIDEDTDWDDIKSALAEACLILLDEDGEPDYGGDILVADTSGNLAHEYLHSSGIFDLDGFVEAMHVVYRNKIDVDAMAAWVSGNGMPSDFMEFYQGHHDSEESFAEQYADDIGVLDGCSEVVRMHFNYESYARDLFTDEFYSERSNSMGVFVFRKG
jgi:hypothetical protein